MAKRSRKVLEWLREKAIPYFAKAFVYRFWASYFKVGIVLSPDDVNLANLPSNKPLLDYLAERFIAHKFDIAQSDTLFFSPGSVVATVTSALRSTVNMNGALGMAQSGMN